MNLNKPMMTHTKGNCSMMEVRQVLDNRWIIGHTSNGSIIYYAKDKGDAEKVLKEWIAAPELLEALELIAKNPFTEDLMRIRTREELCKIAEKAIKKATE
jgi:hypothetical protein